MSPHQFKIGDRVRSMDFKHRTDCYVEVIVSVIDPEMGQYGGKTVLDVSEGSVMPRSSRLGFITRFPMEGRMHRDWPGRLALVDAVTVSA